MSLIRFMPPRGTASQCNAYTGTLGEIFVDTTNWQVRLSDGSTAGGHILGGVNNLAGLVDCAISSPSANQLLAYNGSDWANVSTLPTAAMPGLTGDVTNTAGALATTIAAGAVSLAKMANLAANSILGNNTGSAATPIALTAAQVKTLLAIAAADVSGVLPLTGGTLTGALTGTSGTFSSNLSFNADSCEISLNGTTLQNAIGASYTYGSVVIAGTAHNSYVGLVLGGANSTYCEPTFMASTAALDYGVYDQKAGAWAWIVNSTGFGLGLAAFDYATGGGYIGYRDSTNTGGKVTVSTAAPSGTPAAGDLWIQHA